MCFICLIYATLHFCSIYATLCHFLFCKIVTATCPGGKQFDSDQCKDCPIGFFKGENERFGECIPCETGRPGYVTSEAGAESVEQCDLRKTYIVQVSYLTI